MSINLKTLISKLDDTCRQAAERAANLCMARGNYEVDLEHLFLALLEQPQSDFVLIARRCGIFAGDAGTRSQRGGRSLQGRQYAHAGIFPAPAHAV